MQRRSGRIPQWLKLLFTLWVLVWAPAYFLVYGPQNYLWLCNLANFLILIALWRENSLLMSTQLLVVLVVGTLWTLDVVVAFLFTGRPVLGTAYMFDTSIPLGIRLLSLYHSFLPAIALFGVLRLGYDRRAWLWQTGLTLVVIAVSRLVSNADLNINWVYGPFGQPQTLLPAWLYVPMVMLAWPFVLYLPEHLLCRRLFAGPLASDDNRQHP